MNIEGYFHLVYTDEENGFSHKDFSDLIDLGKFLLSNNLAKPDYVIIEGVALKGLNDRHGRDLQDSNYISEIESCIQQAPEELMTQLRQLAQGDFSD